ncbi:Eosinophil peroxidase [Dissostichus eleginoides]|uniref:Eosinophil peroxidase n=1 Tax=Dissostichus eleginoides TaxID=100907 RepID=A0AAD9F0L3_DISEL|nr:Eosinophil peroxidase [Dissostichus eleginoides]
MLLSALLVLGVCLIPAHSKPAGEHLGSPLLQTCFEEAKKIVDDAYKYSREESLRRVRKEVVRPHDALRLLKQPRGGTRSAVRSADYMAQTLRLLQERVHHVHKRSLNVTDLLSEEDLNKLTEITGCARQDTFPSCRTTPNLNTYRTANSACNNIKNPRLGSSNTPFARWLPAEYDDAISQPKGWDRTRRFNNFLLPLVRQVIRSFSNGINCEESCEKTEPCIPIPIPPGDPRLPTGRNSCIPAFRSAPVCGSGYSAYNFGGEPNKREQINALTAFLDLGQVYGSEEQLAKSVRDPDSDGGLLRVNTEFRDNRRELLPFHPMQVNMCATRKRVTNDTNAREVPCFLAGDVRVDENIALTSIHTLFMREHNRLARQLKTINPQWDSETLYQETRKIMGAYTQLFVFRDYLPHIVGPDTMRRQLGRYPGYNANVDPSIANVFATAAYRFAHLAIQPVISRLDENYRENSRLPSVPLYEAFFTPWRVVFEGGIDPLLRGLVGSPAKLNTQDHMMVDALRERLFQFVKHLALDLGSLNMARGRDHGLPGYNAWRKFCGLSQPGNQAELARVLNNADLARRLLQLYGTPANIDVWMGGVAEPFVRGGRVGPLFACLIASQFQRIRQGDRLWYENQGVFSPAQRAALSTSTISRIICDNTGISTVPTDAFSVISNRNRRVRCSSIRRLNLYAWRDRCRGPGDNCRGVGEEERKPRNPGNPRNLKSQSLPRHIRNLKNQSLPRHIRNLNSPRFPRNLKYPSLPRHIRNLNSPRFPRNLKYPSLPRHIRNLNSPRFPRNLKYPSLPRHIRNLKQPQVSQEPQVPQSPQAHQEPQEPQVSQEPQIPQSAQAHQEPQDVRGLQDNETANYRKYLFNATSDPLTSNIKKGQLPAPPSNASLSNSAFSVRLGEYSPSSERIIRFQEVIYNKQGHYSTETGQFTCVLPGVYQFSFLCKSFLSSGIVDLIRNNKVALRSFKVFLGGLHMSAGDTLLWLGAGDKVWLEASGGTVGLSTESYFSGHWLYAA